MTRILQLSSLIVVAMAVGCERESRSPHESDAVPLKPKVDAVKKASPGEVDQVALSNEWERSREEQKGQYEKMEALAKDVSQVCAGTNGEEAVDALLANVSDLIDEYERGIWDKGNAMGYLTALVSPFVREIESYWAKRRFKPEGTPPENLLSEVRSSYSLATKTVDLLQKKVGNSGVTTSLEIGNCSTLKWLVHNFERAGWKEEKNTWMRWLKYG